MKTVSVKLTDVQYARLQAEAEARGVSKSLVVREALEDSSYPKPKPSLLDLMEGIVGSVEGPADLSTNKKYMEGYGLSRADRRRAARRSR